MWVCEDCRTSNPSDDTSCVVCGARRTAGTVKPTAPTYGPASTRPAPGTARPRPTAARVSKGKGRPKSRGSRISAAPRPGATPVETTRPAPTRAPVPRSAGKADGPGVVSAVLWGVADVGLVVALFAAVVRFFPGAAL